MLFALVCSFYAHELPSMFLIIILGSEEICFLSFHLWAHVKVNRSISLFLFLFILVPCKPFLLLFLCVFFPSLANDIHIFGFASFVPFCFDDFASQLTLMSLVFYPCKCIIWSPFDLPPNFSPPFGFCYSLHGIRVLGVPFGFVLFSFSFL